MRWFWRLATVCLILLTAACSSDPAAGPAIEAPAGPAANGVGHPRVVLEGGAEIRVEVVADPESRAQGLMYRPSLSPDRGMLFIFPETGFYPFWMKNTLIPLDMIWIDESLQIVSVARQVPPCQADPCDSHSPSGNARYVLELAGGRAAQLGVEPGQSVRLEGIENIVAR